MPAAAAHHDDEGPTTKARGRAESLATDAAIVAAATLSHRYISGRQLPDKAIDLVDEAASRIRMEIDSKPEALDRLERQLIQQKIQREALKKESDDASLKRLEEVESEIAGMEREFSDLEEVWKSEKAAVQGATHIKEDLERARAELETAHRAGDLARMSELQYGRIPELEKALEQAEEGEGKQEFQLLRYEVTEDEIAEVVSRWTGIPVSKMLEGERDKLVHMEDRLHRRVIGQEEAVAAVSNAVRRARSGLQDPNRPIGSFIFMGPTGVGKTELAKALAEFIFDSEQAIVRIDMSEYMEKHSVARLIGAPPGYVGYEEGGYLTEAVRRRPYSVVLFDEIEKAHPEVFNIMLQILDDGRMTDGHGRTVDFKNTIVIMTSNVGSQYIQELATASREKMEKRVTEALRASFRPEFLNRIDEIIIFQSLTADEILKIVDIQMNRLGRRLADKNIDLILSDGSKELIAKQGYDPVFGARPLKRIIQKYIENPLSLEILEGNVSEGARVRAVVEGDKIVFTTT